MFLLNLFNKLRKKMIYEACIAFYLFSQLKIVITGARMLDYFCNGIFLLLKKYTLVQKRDDFAIFEGTF